MTDLPTLRGTLRVVILALALGVVTVTQAQPCGRDTDCTIGDRSYRIALPEARAPGAPLGAILFVHGYRGTAEGVIGNRDLTALASGVDIAARILRISGGR